MRQTLLLLLLVPFAVGAAEPPPRTFTAEDLVRLARVSEPRLAPDGRRVVYVLREVDATGTKASRSLYEVPVAGGAPRRLTAPGASSPRWSADGRSIFFLASRGGSSQIWRLPPAGEAQPVTHLPVDVDSFAVSPDGRHLAFSAAVDPACATLACSAEHAKSRATNPASGTVYDRLFVRHWDTWADGTRSQLFLATLDGDGTVHDEPVRLSRGIDGDVPSKPFGDDSEYAFSPDGRVVYFDARVAGNGEPWSTNFDVYAVPTEGDAPPTNLTAENTAWDGYPVPSPDGRHLYYLAMAKPAHEADRFRVMELDLVTHTRREVAPAWDRSAGNLSISADGHTLYATADDDGDHPLVAIDIASGRVTKRIATGHVAEYAQSNDALVVALDTLSTPADLWRVDPNGARTALTAVNAERLAGVTLGRPDVFRFKGWNGDSVRGYVLKPHGYVEGRRYPVAFLIHGGPQGSWLDAWSYRWNPQTYAAAGYAVVVVDFHGSTGYGTAFEEAISEHWGDRPLEDLQKGWAAALASHPFLDGTRACALGASYGGFMVDWIAGVWPKPASGEWKCLVSHDGIFDSRMMYYSTEELWFEETEHGGTPWEHPEHYERFNPATRVGQWRVPMLVIQGDHDYRVPPDQGVAAFTALQRRGIPSEFLRFPDENHWVLKPQNSVLWHHTVEAWLRRFNPPDGP
jgi:dipeptidyl aminopeptidase/acylaminoacyl peptidase